MRRETGGEYEVKVLYGEGFAHRTGPEPCAVDREVGGEASAGGGTGQPLSRERFIPGADDVPVSDRGSVSQALERIRQAARQKRKEKFTALFHHLTIDRLGDAFNELKEDAAAGVDGLTWTEYEATLERNLEDLHAQLHRGAYRALPSRRVYIPKPDGRQRPLAVAALEDKIVQRATATVLNAIYEEDFLGSRMDSDQDAARTMRSTHSRLGSPARK